MSHKELVKACKYRDSEVYDLSYYRKLRLGSPSIKPNTKQVERKFKTDRERVASNRKPTTFGGR